MSLTTSDGGSYCSGYRCDDADEPIPSGDQVWWVKTSYEYDEWSSYCRRCAFEDLRRYDGPWPGDRLPRKPRSGHWPLNLRRVPIPF